MEQGAHTLLRNRIATADTTHVPTAALWCKAIHLYVVPITKLLLVLQRGPITAVRYSRYGKHYLTPDGDTGSSDPIQGLNA